MAVSPSLTDGLHTRWSLLDGLREGSDHERAIALKWFAESYWPAIYAYIRRSGKDPETAQDLTQEFFHHALAGSLVDKADRARGRLRNLVMISLKRFLMTQFRRDTTQRRGGTQLLYSLDMAKAEGWYGMEPVEKATPETLFNRRWLASLLEQAITAVRTAYASRDQTELFESVLPYALSSARDRQGESPAARCGGDRVAAHRVRMQIRQRLLELVSELLEVPTEAAARAELNYLLGVNR